MRASWRCRTLIASKQLYDLAVTRRHRWRRCRAVCGKRSAAITTIIVSPIAADREQYATNYTGQRQGSASDGWSRWWSRPREAAVAHRLWHGRRCCRPPSRRRTG